MADLLVDTDVFVDHLRGARRLRPGTDQISYSVITRCELFAGRGADEQELTRFLASFTELPVEREVAEEAGRVRRSTGIRTPDALVAATALRHGLVLVTRNLRHFQVVGGLQIRAPG